MIKVYFDTRWIGKHGIGRFASEVYSLIQFERPKLGGQPTFFLDPIRLFFYIIFRAKDNSIFLSPGFNVPIAFYSRYICTIHDLNHIDLSANSSTLKKIYYEIVLKNFIKKTKLLFTVSEFTKRRVVEWAGAEKSKIVVVGNGVSDQFNPIGEKYMPGYKYILCVGNRKLHKNEDRIVQAFASAKTESDLRLVFTGSPTNNLNQQIRKFNLMDRVTFLGVVGENELPKIYRGALFLCFPSLYEGFGLPVIEAMASGVPVLTSNTSALPEISNGAAYLVDPHSVVEICQGIEVLQFDSALRSSLISKGLLQAKRYTWQQVIEKIEIAFRDCLGVELIEKISKNDLNESRA